MQEFTQVAQSSEIPQGEGRVFTVSGKEIAIFNVTGKFYAIDNTCPHHGGPLGEGILYEKDVTCPWHGYQIDVTNGRCISPDNTAKVHSYEIKVENQKIFISI